MADVSTGSMNKSEAERMRNLLSDAITTLCHRGIRFEDALKVEGLIAVTVDESDIIVVNINKTYKSHGAKARRDTEAEVARKDAARRDTEAEIARKDAEKEERRVNENRESDISKEDTAHRRKRRKKRRSPDHQGDSDVNGDSVHSDKAESDIPGKKIRSDSYTEPVDAGCHGDSPLDTSSPFAIHDQGAETATDPADTIKIEIDSESESEDSKAELNAQLFGSGVNSFTSMPVEHFEQSNLSEAVLEPMPVSMFEASGLPSYSTSAMSFVSTKTAKCGGGSSQPGVVLPQQGPSEEPFHCLRRPKYADNLMGSDTDQKAIYKCRYEGCLKTYSCQSYLKEHIKVHMSSYPCNHCTEVARTKRELSEHLKDVHPEILYMCSVCDYKSERKFAVRRHSIFLHGVDPQNI